MSGYRGAPVTGSKGDGDYTVNVIATRESSTWTFGDGTSLIWPSLGQPSTASPISHTYRGHELAQPVHRREQLCQVTVGFDTRFQVIGPGVDPGWQDFSSRNLPPRADSATLSYPVGEVISDLTANP